MKRTWVLVLCSVLLLGCSDDPAANDDAGLEAGADGFTDGGIPLTLARGTAGHNDVSPAMSQGQARAGKVTAASQLLQGIKIEGKVGDFKLYNSKVAFIIRDTGWSDLYSPFGGELLDAARVGSKGKSYLGEIILGAGIRALKPTSVGVINDGSDGKAAAIRVIGVPTTMPILASILSASVGGNPQIHLVLEYVLEPDSDVLEIRWRFFNKTTSKLELPMLLMGLAAGDGAEFYYDKVGFQTKGSAPRTDFIAMIHPDVGYAIYSADEELTPLITYVGLSILSNDSLDIPAAGQATRRLYLALTDGEPEAVWRAVRKLRKESEPAAVSGIVSDPSKKVLVGARVHVQTDEATPVYVTMTRSGAGGKYSLALKPGKYIFTVVDDGRAPVSASGVQVGAGAMTRDLSAGSAAKVTFVVTDDTGAALPAKLSFVPVAAPVKIPSTFGEKSYPGKAALVRYSTDGTGEATLPPGDYKIVASRGYEYEIGSASVILAAGDDKSVAFKLKRSVDTTGYMCGDFHVHAMWSPDSSDLYELKAAAAAAEGLEIPVTTDHEYIADMSPYVAKLGLQKWVKSVVGEELTTFLYGHFNPFPITRDPKQPNQGAMIWYDKTPAELFADVDKAWPDAVFQVNHPRSASSGGYFSFVGYDAATGTAKKKDQFSRNFDALEVFNNSGWTSNFKETVQDWFSFLDRGVLVSATGNSDSHNAYTTEVGYPRNCVALSTDVPANLDLKEFAKAIKAQRLLVSGGPFITVDAGGKSMGQVVDAKSKKVTLSIKVQAPTWMTVDTLRVIVGGAEKHKLTLDGTTSDPTNPVIRYNSSVELLPTQDTWVIVVATGAGTLDPVTAGQEPFAVTNPIYLDVDGDGVYDPPKSFK